MNLIYLMKIKIKFTLLFNLCFIKIFKITISYILIFMRDNDENLCLKGRKTLKEKHPTF